MGQIGECGQGGSADPKTCIKAGPAHGQNVLLDGQTLGDVFVVGRWHCAHGAESTGWSEFEQGGGDDGSYRAMGSGGRGRCQGLLVSGNTTGRNPLLIVLECWAGSLASGG